MEWKRLVASAIRETHSRNLWMDAWLAAFALRSGFQMITTIMAFSQFKGLELLMAKAVRSPGR